MKRMHIHVSVQDLDQSIGFYSALFGAEPVKTKPDFAKWMLEQEQVLVTDTTYTDAEYPRRVGWGHSSVSQVADLAHRASVKTLCIAHHDPSQTDDDIDAKLAATEAALAALGSRVSVCAPAEGDTLRV